MKAGRSFMILGASLFFTGAIYASGSASDPGQAVLVTGQSSSQPQASGPSDQQMQEQARESRKQPSHTEFGGQPKDEAARERHHQQNPQSAQHLGPQESDEKSGGTQSGGARGAEESRQGSAPGGTR